MAKTPQERELDRQLNLIKQVFPREFAEISELVDQIDKIEATSKAQTSFLAFVKSMWPGFIEAPHHRIMDEVIEGVMNGSKRRTIVNMAPRHTKSEFYSYLLPAFYLGRYPTRKIIQICATATMAQDWSRKVRN